MSMAPVVGRRAEVALENKDMTAASLLLEVRVERPDLSELRLRADCWPRVRHRVTDRDGCGPGGATSAESPTRPDARRSGDAARPSLAPSWVSGHLVVVVSVPRSSNR